ncbi:MAG: cytochrome c oxidase subunit II [Bryobacteraceae bacterium]
MGSIPLLPPQASSVAGEVDTFYFLIVGISAFFTILICALVVVMAIKYRRKSDTDRPKAILGSVPLELVWTIIPLVICMVLFVWSAKLYMTLITPPEDAIEMYATGKQWMWKIQHRNGKREINELHIPLGQAVKLKMTSEDVIHSFFVPAFRTKMDVVPGRYTTTWFRPTAVGKYHLFCAEYCGTKHSGMIGWVYVLQPDEYQKWLQGDVGEGTLAQRGERLFNELGCANCHRIDGKGRGPSLVGVFGEQVELEKGGKVLADEAYLRESILNSGAKVVAGYQPIMPIFQGLVTEDQVLQLIEYLKSIGKKQKALSAPGAKPAPPAKVAAVSAR